MRFFFTEEDDHTRIRGADIRSALVAARHDVLHGRHGDAAPAATDVWMHGLGVDAHRPLEPMLVASLMATRAQLVLFQLCDAPSMWFHRLPPELMERTRLFLRNHWPSDRSGMPPQVRDRIGWLPPMLKTMPPRAGRPLSERAIATMFYGTRTGGANLPGGRNAREEAVRLMYASGLPFEGGLLPHNESHYDPPAELTVARIHKHTHTRRLRNARICIAPWGNHPLTYRVFEGLACRCLVIAQSLRDCAIVDDGLAAGRHYVEVAADLSDLTELTRHYLRHPDEAQRIADAGHQHFVARLAARGPLVSQWIFGACVASWGSLYKPSAARGLVASLRGLAARLGRRY
ncbi:MAG TPA: glycosyltransferase [Burkholderiaceae bacterium]|nr:glycosyltransferase [Burkholderiaceae bacterium]